MKCKFLVDYSTPGCIAGEVPYIQTGFQTEEYCKKSRAQKMSFLYQAFDKRTGRSS